jgi:hypothetical protein
MLSDWWNGVELWVAGLAFPFQFALVMAVLAPVCMVVAYLIDRVVDHASALFGPSRTEDRPIRSSQPDPEQAPTGTDAEPVEVPVEEPAVDAEVDERVPAASAGR